MIKYIHINERRILMAYKNIIIGSNTSVNFNNEHIIIDDGEIHSIPITDIKSIVFKSENCSVSTYTISKLVENNICIITFDNKHIPHSNIIQICKHKIKQLFNNHF